MPTPQRVLKVITGFKVVKGNVVNVTLSYQDKGLKVAINLNIPLDSHKVLVVPVADANLYRIYLNIHKQ